MSVASLPLTTSRSSTWARRQLRGRLASGLVIGLSASGVFLPLLAQRAISSATNDAIGWVAVAIVIGAATTGGVWFARLVARGRGEAASWKTTASIGIAFALAGTIGLFSTFSIADLVGHTLVHRSLSDLEAFRVAFVTASAEIALVCTLVGWKSFGLPWRGGVATALLVAGVTAATYCWSR